MRKKFSFFPCSEFFYVDFFLVFAYKHKTALKRNLMLSLFSRDAVASRWPVSKKANGFFRVPEPLLLQFLLFLHSLSLFLLAFL